jgi:hypothetical protein
MSYPFQPGDLLLVRTNHFVSRLIRFGQRSYGKDAAQFNHCAVYIGNGEIVEALTNGVVRGYASKYPAKDTRVLSACPRVPANVHMINTEYSPPPGVRPAVEFAMRANARDFAISCVGEKYGFLTIFAIAVKVLTKGKIDFNLQGTSICSGLAARSLERLGYDFNPWDPAELTPAYLYTVLV